MNMTRTVLDEAIDYANRGLPVFPLDKKIPLIKDWPNQATTDLVQIRKWDKRFPGCNWGMVTGTRSKILAVDIDPRNDGDETWTALEKTHGPLPETVRVITGNDGEHWYFSITEEQAGLIQPGTGKLGLGVDVKCNGGYVVIPGSVHPEKGKAYQFSVDGHPDEIRVAPVPKWMLDTLKTRVQAPPSVENDKIFKGRRNEYLTRWAGRLRNKGETPETIITVLIGLNQANCVPPLSVDEVRTIGQSIGRYPPDSSVTKNGNDSPWSKAVPVTNLLKESDKEILWYVARLLAPGSITEIFCPRGVGKTHVAHALAVQMARDGHRVLLLDRDNSRREIKRRLKGWGGEQTPDTLKVLTREDAPSLTDKKAWETFPFDEYDVVIIDSLDSSAEGVGEKDSSRPSQAIAPILDIAHRSDGPAILILCNTIKSGEHGRGSGVIEDRADICYEVRDATGLEPTGTKDWWQELPASGSSAWGNRASRRKRCDVYQLAFVPSKFRIGEEPEPFVYQIDLRSPLWTLSDVTQDILVKGCLAQKEAIEEKNKAHTEATQALSKTLQQGPMNKTEAVRFLMKKKLDREDARTLIENGKGHLWTIDEVPRKGKPKILKPLFPQGGNQESSAEIIPDDNIPINTDVLQSSISADAKTLGGENAPLTKTPSMEGISAAGLFPPTNITESVGKKDAMEGAKVHLPSRPVQELEELIIDDVD